VVSSCLVILSFSAFFEIKGAGIEYCPGKASRKEMVNQTSLTCTRAFLQKVFAGTGESLLKSAKKNSRQL